MRPSSRPAPRVLLLAAVALLGPAGCTSSSDEVPRCDSVRRVAIIAQAVTGAAYVPCIGELPPGWRSDRFAPRRGQVSFELTPGPGGVPVLVDYDSTCAVTGAIPTKPRAAGVRTSLRLTSVTPRYAGTLIDEFPGGCITYRFDFTRGAHISLMEQLQSSAGLLSRRELRLALHRELSVELDP